MLERLIHEPLAREIRQPLLTLSSLNKIDLIWFDLVFSPFSPSFPFPCVACHACHAYPFIFSASMLRRLWDQRYCRKCNIPDFTRHGCCHQVSWNVILLSWNIKTHYCVSLKSLSIVLSLLRLTENNMGGFFRIVFYTILSFHHTWSKGKWFIYVLVAHNFKIKLLLSCF